MIHDTDLASLETEIRAYIGEASARFWGQTGIFRAANSEFGKMCRDALEADRGYFLTSATTTITQKTIQIPRYYWKVRAVGVYRDSRWYPIWHIDTSEIYQYWQSSNNTALARAIRFEGRNMILEPGYANVSQIKIYYERVPAPLLYGTAQAADATTITLPATAAIHDDAYNGDEFEILDGTGVGQSGTATDYVGSTKVATFATFGTPPDSTSVISTLLPDPINKFPTVLCLGAARRLIVEKRDGERWQMLSQQYAEDYQEYKNSLDTRQTDQPKYGEYVPREDDF
jgi:hypothetical protein